MENQEFYNANLICSNCGTGYVDRNKNPDEFLCSECRAKLTKMTVPLWLKVASLLSVLVLIGTSYFAISSYIKVTEEVKTSELMHEQAQIVLSTANQYVADKKPASAVLLLYDYMTDNPSNTEVAYEACLISMDHGFYDYATYFDGTYLSGKYFTNEEIQKLNNIDEEITRYYNTIDFVDTVLAQLSDSYSDGLTEDEITKLREDAKNSLYAELDNPEIEPLYIKYILAYYLSENDDWENTIWLFIDSSFYPPVAPFASAIIARSDRSKGALDSAMEWIETGEQFNAENYTLRRSKATILLASGKYADALTIMQDLYAIAPDEDYVVDTLAVALFANGQIDAMNKLIDEWTAKGYEFDEDFFSLINGDLTIFDYYVKGVM